MQPGALDWHRWRLDWAQDGPPHPPEAPATQRLAWGHSGGRPSTALALGVWGRIRQHRN